MENKVKENIISNLLIEPGDTVLAAVSGGPDSMAMLYCLFKLTGQMDFRLAVAHVNHGVRGKEAERDQHFVEAEAGRLGIPYHTTNVDMVGYGRELGISSEEAGRILRYGFFRDVLKGYGKGKIAVAHNMNDQAETILYRIMRGTGISGIKGMSIIKDGVIRPLLNIPRGEIEEYISINNIDIVQDHTNLETVYTRNRIRLELLPYIIENFNPNIIEGLFRLSMTAAADMEIIEAAVEKKYKMVVKKQEDNSIIFKGRCFNDEPIGMRSRLIRKAIHSVKGDLNGIEEKHINSVLNLFEKAQTGSSLNLPAEVAAMVIYEDLIIAHGGKVPVCLPTVELKLGKNWIPDWGLEIELEVIDPTTGRYPKGNTVVLDADMLKGPLLLRQRMEGDRFSPIGLNGSKKLKDYFIDKKIPRHDRDIVPILIDSEGIIWVAGHSIDQRCRLGKDTKKALKICCKKTDNI